MIGLRLDGADRLIYRLDGMMLAMRNLTPAWKQVAEVLRIAAEKNFSTQGAYSGRTWPPLSPAYAKVKAAKYGNKPILQRTGQMYESLVKMNHSQHVQTITPEFFEWGTRVPYARWHQTGTGARRGGRAPVARGRLPRLGRERYIAAGQLRGMPARPPLPRLTQAEGAAIADILLAHVLRSATHAP
jgi:phage gpG-like protein